MAGSQTSAHLVRTMLADVCSLPLPTDDAERIELIRALEELAGGVAAASHAAVVDLESARIARDAADGVPVVRRGRGTAEEVALARRCSPGAASRDLTVSRTLCRDLPGVHGLLATGRIGAWSARVVAAEVAVLDPTDRRVVDERLTASGELPGWSPAQARAATARLVAEVDVEAAVKRASRARGDRRVSLRPQPDTMVSLTALLPVEQGVAASASLEQHARAVRAAAAVPIEVRLVVDGDSASLLDGLAPVKRLIRARDQRCRVPYCTAPIRHVDHAHPHTDGGATTPANGIGTCERHNLVKEAAGWTATPDVGSGVVRFTTGTGHAYDSRPPPAVGPTARPPDRPRPRVQRFYPRVDHHLDASRLHVVAYG